MRRFAILVAMFVVTVVATTTSALAGGGNSGAAAACQQDGWQSLYRSDGTGFTNTGDCVSYAARGGTLQTQCQPGSWSPTGVTPCTPAGVGYYVDTAGATAQTPCPAGMTTAGTGSTTAADCVSAGPTITSATWTSCARAGCLQTRDAPVRPIQTSPRSSSAGRRPLRRRGFGG